MTTFLIALQYVLIAAASLVALGVVLALVVLGAFLVQRVREGAE